MLISEGFKAFKAAVGNLAYDETDVADAKQKLHEKTLQEYYAARNTTKEAQERAFSLIQNITKAGGNGTRGGTQGNQTSGGFDGASITSAGILLAIIVLAIAVIIPLAFLALIIYAGYWVLKKIFGKKESKPGDSKTGDVTNAAVKPLAEGKRAPRQPRKR